MSPFYKKLCGLLLLELLGLSPFVSGLIKPGFNQKGALSAFSSNKKQAWGTHSFIFYKVPNVVNYSWMLLTSVAGVFIYGHIVGVSITTSVSSLVCAIFYLVQYGPAFVQSVVSKRTYDKKLAWWRQSFWSFSNLYDDLANHPADFLLYAVPWPRWLSRHYMIIIILCKPFTPVVYTYGFDLYYWSLLANGFPK